MKNEIEQIAQQNDMSIEFVTWFFNEKKVRCGNVWFMMMAAMWEGWKGHSIEIDKLAAENVEAKKIISECREYFIAGVMNRIRPTNEGYLHMICDTFADETPATDRIVAGIKADGVEEFISLLQQCVDEGYFAGDEVAAIVGAIDCGKESFEQLREGGREMSIATYLNTGLAILGWAYIMVKTGQWITKNALRQWDKRRKESRRQKAVNEFYDAFELNSLEPGSTVRLATKGDLTIMMFRSEGAK